MAIISSDNLAAKLKHNCGQTKILPKLVVWSDFSVLKRNGKRCIPDKNPHAI